MNIDWNEVWAAAVGAAEGVVKDAAPKAKTFVRQTMQARERRLKLLMLAIADGALDEQSIDQELREEQDILEMELAAAQVLGKKTAQDAVNAAFKIIEDALVKGIALTI